MKKIEVLTNLEQMVLTALLMLGEDAYSLAVHEQTEVVAKRRFQVPSVYIVLQRMVEKGYVKSWVAAETPERGNKRSKYFRLLPAGQQALHQALDESAATSKRLLDLWSEYNGNPEPKQST
jgi:DNA-binding MarR family transcriptional regulator